jgi:hypothetical protein
MDMAPENRRITGRDASGRFRQGISGNPGGRPRAIATVILERRPNVSEELVAFWSLVAFGSAGAVKRKYGVAPRLSDRLAAAAALADRLHGRPVIGGRHGNAPDTEAAPVVKDRQSALSGRFLLSAGAWQSRWGTRISRL